MLELEPHSPLTVFVYFLPPARRRLIRDLISTSLLTNKELPYYLRYLSLSITTRQ